jgi:hypothetical protein
MTSESVNQSSRRQTCPASVCILRSRFSRTISSSRPAAGAPPQGNSVDVTVQVAPFALGTLADFLLCLPYDVELEPAGQVASLEQLVEFGPAPQLTPKQLYDLYQDTEVPQGRYLLSQVTELLGDPAALSAAAHHPSFELDPALADIVDLGAILGIIIDPQGNETYEQQVRTAGLRLARTLPGPGFPVRPVRPPADPQAAAALAELRQLGRLLRDAELKGQRDPPMAARYADLQREVREHDWQASGLGRATAQASLGEVNAALEQSRQSLVGILARHGRLLAVVAGRGSARLIELGDLARAAEAARRLNTDLDILAGRRLPARVEAVVRGSIRHQTDTLTAEILAPLRSSLGDDGVVFVPAGPLASIPWSVLPDLRGRPVTVCASASSWLAAWRRGQVAGTGPASTPPVLVAGPDLEHAIGEVTEIAKMTVRSWPTTSSSWTRLPGTWSCRPATSGGPWYARARRSSASPPPCSTSEPRP